MPFSKPTGGCVMGIDAGATLCKIAFKEGNSFVTRSLPAGELAAIRDYIAARSPARIVAAGGGAGALAGLLGNATPAHVERTDEFGAWLRGAPALAAQEGLSLPERYLLVSLGTGTSVLLAKGHSAQRVGGSALGGGTLMGLAELLTGVREFEAVAALAARGDRRRVDLLVGDIYASGDAPLPGDLNASSFAKLGSRAPEDLAQALMGLVGENVGLICSTLATLHAVPVILYCGSTVAGNPVLRGILAQLAGATGHRACFLESGAYCGAVGAALMPDPRSGGRAG